MLTELLVRENVLEYYRSQVQTAYAPPINNQYDCIFVRYLKNLNVVDNNTLRMDWDYINYGDGQYERIPVWVVETIEHLTELNNESIGYLKMRDIVGVLEGSIVREEKSYTFDELPEKIQQKKYEEWLNSGGYDFEIDSSFVYDLENDIANETQGDNIDIRYSLGGGQGDGASFTGKIDIEHFITDVTGTKSEYPLLMYVIGKGDLYDTMVEIYEVNSHYTHSKSVKVGRIAFAGDAKDIEEIAEEEIDNLQAAMQEWVEERSQDIYSELQNEYDSMISFETFRENEVDEDKQYYDDGQEV